RVVNRLGELAPDHVFGGRQFQRMLLEMEGVAFLADGRIDLKTHLWIRQKNELEKDERENDGPGTDKMDKPQGPKEI
ncbi:hypothetical protein LJC41_08990, partial [Desulfosarcina sp. OttesenSCG-928-G17]|nr:hypothetical protein [Desulfosarcina sp. OttesenSCG-928-G17]